MTWDGEERRQVHICTQEKTLREIASTMSEMRADVRALDKRINGSIDNISLHVERGGKWRIAIATIGAALFVNVIVFAYMFGIVYTTTKVNERILQRIMSKYEVINIPIKTINKPTGGKYGA